MKMFRSVTLAAASMLVALTAQSSAAQTIDTRNASSAATVGLPNSNGNYVIQTFTAVAGFANLLDFSVWISGASTQHFTVRLFNQGGGGTLFDSGVLDGPGGGSTQYTFTPGGGIMLTPNDVYGVYLTYTGGSGDALEVVGHTTDSYSGGQVYTSDNGNNLFPVAGVPDVDFVAHFGRTAVATPEPASVLLVGTGLSGLGVFVRRRRHR